MSSETWPITDILHTTSAFTIGDSATALHRFAVILDPLSEQAQKYTSLFEVFTGSIIH
jgi:UDP-glucose:glycoprotein glucosyltransferase